MTSIELCRMCTEYSADTRCEYKKDCKLQKILTENKALRAENKRREQVKPVQLSPFKM